MPDVRYGGIVEDRRLFARDVVRFEGEIVAAVAATTPEIAAAAVALIEVEYEPLPPLTRPGGGARATDAPSSTRTGSGYEATSDLGRDGQRLLGRSTIVKGDVDVGAGRGRTSSSSGATSPTARRACRSSRARSSPSGRATRSPSGRRRRCRSSPAPASRKTLQMPESRRPHRSCPLLGGGFGAKCDFHFEGHVAALARAAGRPVKLVFSRREEFIAPDHRREGDADRARDRCSRPTARSSPAAPGSSSTTARTAAKAASSPQLAAMHACGPYRVENVVVEAHLAYTNTPPSGSIRAPDRAAVCWALEQHMDELAARARSRSARAAPADLIEDGRRDGDAPGARAHRRRRDARAGGRADRLRARAARRRGDRRRVRLVALLRRRVGRVREAERRRHGHDRDRRAGERHAAR